MFRLPRFACPFVIFELVILCERGLDENLKPMSSTSDAPQSRMQDDDDDGLVFDDELDETGLPLTLGDTSLGAADEEAREKEQHEGKQESAAVDVEIRRRSRRVPNFNENHLVGSKGIASLHYLAWHHMRGMGGKPLFQGEGHEVRSITTAGLLHEVASLIHTTVLYI